MNIVNIKDYSRAAPAQTFTSEDLEYLEKFSAYLKCFYIIDDHKYLTTTEGEPVVPDEYNLYKFGNVVFSFLKSDNVITMFYGYDQDPFAGAAVEQTDETVCSLVVGMLGFTATQAALMGLAENKTETFTRPAFQVVSNDGESMCSLSHDHVEQILQQHEFTHGCNDEGRTVLTAASDSSLRIVL